MEFPYEAHMAGEAWRDAGMQAAATAEEWRRPSVLYRPRVYPDGNQWCALCGEDLQMGVAGFGSTPEEACAAFDEAWRSQTTPTPGEGEAG